MTHLKQHIIATLNKYPRGVNQETGKESCGELRGIRRLQFNSAPLTKYIIAALNKYPAHLAIGTLCVIARITMGGVLWF